MVVVFSSTHIEFSRFSRFELVHDFIPPNACAVSGISVVEVMLPSFPSLFFEGWPVAESGVERTPIQRLLIAINLSSLPTMAPEIRNNCFCRDEPTVETAVKKQVVTAVLIPGQSTPL